MGNISNVYYVDMWVGYTFIVGIGDDLIGVNYRAKFAAQIFVACLFPLSGLWINNLYGVGLIVALPAWIGMPFTVFVVVLIINAINLMDGLDGLCSGLVGLGCVVLGGLFMYYGAWLHALFAFLTAGVLIPFSTIMFWNYSPPPPNIYGRYRKYDIRIFHCFPIYKLCYE